MYLLLPKPRELYPSLPPKLKACLGSLFKEEEARYFNVIALKRDVRTGLYSIHRAHNIVTDAGDIHVAQRAAGTTPTNAWDTTAQSCLYLRTDTATPGKGSTYSATNAIAPTTGKTAAVIEQNNLDADNTGKGTKVATRKWSCTTGEFNNATIIGAYIAVASAAGGAAVYAVWDFTSFAKTSSDTLTVWHNSSMLGV